MADPLEPEDSRRTSIFEELLVAAECSAPIYANCAYLLRLGGEGLLADSCATVERAFRLLTGDAEALGPSARKSNGNTSKKKED